MSGSPPHRSGEHQAVTPREIDEAKTKDQESFEKARSAAAKVEGEARLAVKEAQDRLQLATEQAQAGRRPR